MWARPRSWPVGLMSSSRSARRTRRWTWRGPCRASPACSWTPTRSHRLPRGPWSASAVKMAYAAWTKGTAALLLSVRALARAEGVQDTLLREWKLSQPGLEDRSRGAAQSAMTKGWRWVGEMEEIAEAMAGASLPDGFHQAAAEIYRRSPRAPADALSADTAADEVFAALTGEPVRGD